jgi:hypothetical protein
MSGCLMLSNTDAPKTDYRIESLSGRTAMDPLLERCFAWQTLR